MKFLAPWLLFFVTALYLIAEAAYGLMEVWVAFFFLWLYIFEKL